MGAVVLTDAGGATVVAPVYGVGVGPRITINQLPITANFNDLLPVGTLSHPVGVATASNGHFYVADSGNGHVTEYDAGGGVVNDIGPVGSQPSALAVAGDGSVYVAVRGSSAIVRIDPAFTSPATTISILDLNLPLAMAVAGDGTIYVSTFTSGPPASYKIRKYVPHANGSYTGTDFVTTWAANIGAEGGTSGPLVFPEGLLLDDAGNLYVSDNGIGQMVRVDSLGAQTLVATKASLGVQGFAGMALDPAGNMYFTDGDIPGGGHVAMFNVGQTLPASVKTDLRYTLGAQYWGVALDSAGSLFVADNANGSVGLWDRSGGGNAPIIMPAVPLGTPTAPPSSVQIGNIGNGPMTWSDTKLLDMTQSVVNPFEWAGTTPVGCWTVGGVSLAVNATCQLDFTFKPHAIYNAGLFPFTPVYPFDWYGSLSLYDDATNIARVVLPNEFPIGAALPSPPGPPAFPVDQTVPASQNVAIVAQALQFTPTIAAFDCGHFAYDAAPHTCAGTEAQAKDELLQVLDGTHGSFAYTYAPADPPQNPGTYTVTATWTSTDVNYTNATGTGTLAIDPIPVVATITAAPGKVYDGTTAETIVGITCSLAGVQVGDTVTCDPISAAFDNKNVAPNHTVTVNVGLGGVDAWKYTLPNPNPTFSPVAITALDIGPVASVTIQDKVYDGGTAATITACAPPAGVISPDVVTCDFSAAVATFTPDGNVGNGKTVDVTGLALAGADAGNYNLNPTTATTTGNITVRTLVPVLSVPSRPYDGTTDAPGATCLFQAPAVGPPPTGVVGADDVQCNVVSAAFANKNVGTGKTVNGTVSLTGTAAGNYVLSMINPTTTADITPLDLGPGGVTLTVIAKVYDGTSHASTICTIPAALPGDSVSCYAIDANYTVGAPSYAFDKNVGVGKDVLAHLGLTGPDAGNYTLSPMLNPMHSLGDIGALTIAPSVTADSKPYDGNTTAVGHCTLPSAAAGIIPPGVIPPDVVNCNVLTANFSDPNVGTGKTVTMTLGLSGADSMNYSLTPGPYTALANIGALTLTPTIVANNKVYDATTTATISSCTLATIMGADDVSCVVDSANFSDKHVGVGKTVTATIHLTGAQAGNYVLSTTAPTTTANITPAPLTPSITADNKVYDGTTIAVVHCSVAVILGSPADVVTCSPAAANFATPNVGVGITVTATGITLAGADAGNYALTTDSATATADITARPLIPVLTITPNPVTYNGSANAAAFTSCTFAPFVAAPPSGVVVAPAEVVNCSVVSATFAADAGCVPDANVGNKTVCANVAMVGVPPGTEANYVLMPANPTTTATISPATVTINWNPITKVYDGTNVATATCSLSGVINPPDGPLTCTAAGGTYDGVFPDNKNVGVGKPVTIPDIVVAGPGFGNYTWAPGPYHLSGDITPAPLTITITGQQKTYGELAYLPTCDAVLDTAHGVTPTNFFTTSPSPLLDSDSITCIPLSTGPTGPAWESASWTGRHAHVIPFPWYAITAGIPQGVGLGNYTITMHDGTVPGPWGRFRVLRADPTLILQSNSFMYDGSPKIPTVVAQGVLFPPDDPPPVGGGYEMVDGTNTFSYLPTPGACGAFNPCNGPYKAGDYTVRDYFNSSNGDYNDVGTAFNPATVGTMTIHKADPVIAWSSVAGHVYDAGTAFTTFPLDAVVLNPPGLLGDPNCAGAPVGSTCVNGFVYTFPAAAVVPGPQTLTVTFYPLDSANNNVVSLNVTVTGKMIPQIVWHPVTITYGTPLGADQLNAVAKDPVSGVTIQGTFIYSPLAGVVLPAGDQTLHVSFTPLDTANYNSIADTTTLLIVNQAPLTITAHDAGKTYGQAIDLGTLGFTITGGALLNGEHITGVTLFSSGTAETAGAGTYPIVPSNAVGNGGFLASNYSIAYQNGTLTVGKLAVILKADGGKVKTYGQVFSDYTFVTIPAPLPNGDAVTPSFSSAGAAADAAYGTYDIVIGAGSMASGDANNYTFTTQNAAGGLVVRKAELNASCPDLSRPYGDLNPTLEGTITGVLGADGITVSCTTSAGQFTGIGTYAITATLVDNLGRVGNYNVHLVNGSLHIVRRPATVTASANEKVYGEGEPALGGTSTGFVDNMSLTCTRTSGQSVANSPYTISCAVVPANILPNYDVTYTTALFAIAPLPVDITAQSTSRVYGAPNPGFGTTVSPSFLTADGIVVSASTSAIATSPAGEYAIVPAATGAGITNYAVTAHNGVLTITPATASAVVTIKTKIYDGLTVAEISGCSLNGIIGTDDVHCDVSGATATFIDKNVGIGKRVDVSGLALSGTKAGSYTLAPTTITTGTIIPKAASVTPNAKTKVYGDADPALDGVLVGFVPADNIVATYKRTQGQAIAGSPYIISVDTLTPTVELTNYTITYNTATFAITARPVTITAADASKVYGATNPAFTASVTLGNFLEADGIVLTASSQAIATSPAGTYAIVPHADGLGIGNYAVTPINGTLTVTAAPATAVVTIAPKMYDGTTAATIASCTLSGIIGTDDVACSTTGATATFDDRHAGLNKPVTITGLALSGAKAGSYSLASSTVHATATITVKPASVTPNAKTKVYGNADPELDGVLSGFESIDAVTAAYSRVAGESIANSPYAISAVLTAGGAGATLADYQITYNTAPFSITARPVTITAADATKVYGATNPVFTASVTLGSFLEADGIVLNATSAAIATSPAGPYAIVPVADGPGIGNYAVTAVNGTLTVTPATVHPVVTIVPKVYDGTTAAAVAACTVPDAIGTDQVGCTASGATFNNRHVGIDKPVTVATVTLTGAKAASYTAAPATGNGTITVAPASVTPNPKTKVYGGADPELDGTLTGFFAIDGVTATYSRVAGETIAGGPYTISAMLSAGEGAALTDYAITYNTAPFSITARPVTVTADNQTRTYGAANPTLTGSATTGSFLAADAIVISYSTVAGATSNVGSYPIVPAVEGPGLNNYAVTFVNGALTVTPASLTLTAKNASRIYGSPNPTFDCDVVGAIAGDGVSCTTSTSANVRSSVGAYDIVPAAVIPAAKTGDYTVTLVNGTLTITQMPLVITPDSGKLKPYGTVFTAFTGLTIPATLPNDDTLAITYASTGAPADANVGFYDITVASYTVTRGVLEGQTFAVGGGNGLGNYAVQVDTAVNGLTVVPGTPTVTVNCPTGVVYDGQPHSCTASVTGVNGADIASQGTLVIDPATETHAGTYTITATWTPTGPNPNYSAATGHGTLVIALRPLTVATEDATKVYGTALPALTCHVNNLVEGEVVTCQAQLEPAVVPLSNVGAYHIATIVSSNPPGVLSNYEVINAGATLTVTPAATSTAVATSDYSLNLPGSITLTATVTSSVAGTPAPAGSVAFMAKKFDGSGTEITLGTSNTNASGVATLAVSSSTLYGKLNVWAVYTPATPPGNFQGSNSPMQGESGSLIQYIWNGAPSFTMAAAPNAVTIARGGSAPITVTLTSVNGYNGTVSFTCGNLPTLLMTCGFQAQTVTLNFDNNPTTTTTLTVSAVPALSAAIPQSRSIYLASFTLGFGGFGLVLAGGVSRRSRKSRKYAVLMIGCGILLLLAMSACGGKPAVQPVIPTQTPTGTFTGSFAVTGTANTDGTAPTNPNQTLTVTITVTP